MFKMTGRPILAHAHTHAHADCRRGSLVIWVTWRNQTDSPLAEKDDLFTRWQLVGTATDCVLGELPDSAQGKTSVSAQSLALASRRVC